MSRAWGSMEGEIPSSARGARRLTWPTAREIAFHVTGLSPYGETESPPWFAEGLARYCERRFVRNSPFPTAIAPCLVLTPLDAEPYENDAQAIDYLVARAGLGSIAQLFGQLANRIPFGQAFTETYVMTVSDLQAALRNR